MLAIIVTSPINQRQSTKIWMSMTQSKNNFVRFLHIKPNVVYIFQTKKKWL